MWLALFFVTFSALYFKFSKLKFLLGMFINSYYFCLILNILLFEILL